MLPSVNALCEAECIQYNILKCEENVAFIYFMNYGGKWLLGYTARIQKEQILQMGLLIPKEKNTFLKFLICKGETVTSNKQTNVFVF